MAEPTPSSAPLKPCPFCGASASGHEIEPHQHSAALLALVPDMPKEHHGSYVIEGDCQCGSGLIGDNQAEVTARWNTRAPLKTAEGAISVTEVELTPEQKRGLISSCKGPLPGVAQAVAVVHCTTCNDQGAVGNILTAEPCPDCSTPPLATRTAPERIWLDLGAEEAEHANFAELGEVTWSPNNATGHGISYVRADALAVAVPKAFNPREDAERLKSVARGMSYNDHSEAVWKHTILEIATRLETGSYTATPALPATEDSSAGDLVDWVSPVSELLGHISDALSDDAFDKIDTAKWNAVSSLVGINRKAPAPAEVLAEPVAKISVYMSSEFGKGEPCEEVSISMIWNAVEKLPLGTHKCYLAPQAQPADALDAADWECLAIGRAINRAALVLPVDGEIRIEVENGAGAVYVNEPKHGEWRYIDSGDAFSSQINAAIDAAMAAAQEGGNAAKEA